MAKQTTKHREAHDDEIDRLDRDVLAEMERRTGSSYRDRIMPNDQPETGPLVADRTPMNRHAFNHSETPPAHHPRHAVPSSSSAGV